jgi:hypothetical protein
MRPKYETSTDLKKEKMAVQTFVDSFGEDVQIAKLPLQYRMDFCLVKDGVVLNFVEVKCRSNKMSAYSTYIISTSKIVAARSYYDINISCILLVDWSDKMGWVELSKNDWPSKIGGRKDRGDWQDIEPVTHIPLSEFKVVEKRVLSHGERVLSHDI